METTTEMIGRTADPSRSRRRRQREEAGEQRQRRRRWPKVVRGRDEQVRGGAESVRRDAAVLLHLRAPPRQRARPQARRQRRADRLHHRHGRLLIEYLVVVNCNNNSQVRVRG